MLLGGAGWLYAPGSYDLDFSHTLTLDYQGPVGSVTHSVSGVFANIGTLSGVPEPSSLALVFAALTAAGWIKRAPRGRRVAPKPMLSNLVAAAP